MPQFARIVQFRNNLTCYLLLVFQTAFTASCALALSDAQLQYTRQVWHIQDGLPEDTVQAMQQTPDGYLWIGTTGGLARFDGSHFLTYRRNSTPAITENSVFCLLTARDGSLWLGTEGGGLLHFEHGQFHAYTAREGLTDGFVRSVIEDETGRLWVGTDNGLFRIRNGIVQRVDTSRFAPSLAIHSIFEDREHRIWAGGSRLLMFDGEDVRQFRLPGAYSQNRVKSILQTSDGTVWVGTVGGLQRLSHGLFAAVPGIAATVRAMRQTADGTLWIGTIGQGLYTFARNELHRVSGNG
jgi:ligand-binding sensor domain-containing protein